MASPRRARSLFLSPDKAELLAAKEINGLVHRVDVVPRKPVPRQGRQTDNGVETSAGGEGRASSTSSINAVDTFCDEYRPPSVSIHRLSNLNKDLPPSPSPKTSNQALSHSTALSRTSTQRHAAAQTVISIQSRYSTRVKPSTPSRLSTHSSHIASQHRLSEDRISIRSHFSTQDSATGQAVPHAEPHASVAIDRRQRSVAGVSGKKNVGGRKSGSVSPGTLPDQETRPTVAGREIQVAGRQGTEIDPRICRDIQDPRIGRDRREVALRSKSTRETSVGWSFHDGFILRAGNSPKSRTGMSPRGESLALESRSKPMIPIRWTFRDGIIYKAVVVPNKANGVSGARSRRLKPIGWSFYDGLTIRSVDLVKATSKAKGDNKETVRASKSDRIVPIGWTFHEGIIFAGHRSAGNGTVMASSKRFPISWTFHDGLTIATHKPVTSTLNPSNENHGMRTEGSWNRLPVTWTFHEGLKFVTHEPVKSALASSDNSNGVKTEAVTRQLPITWSFHDGLTIRNNEPINSDAKYSDKSNGTEKESSVRRLPITWTFYDGLSVGASVNQNARAASNNGESASESKSKRSVGWTFNDGIFVRNVVEGLPRDKTLVPNPQERCLTPEASGFDKGSVAVGGDILDETAGNISSKSLTSDPLSVSQTDEPSPKAIDSNEASCSVSLPCGEVQQHPSIEEVRRARAVALAQRQSRHQSPSELNQLILEGQLIYDQFRQQAQRLQKEKVLVDEMLTILGSSSKDDREVRSCDTNGHRGANDGN